MRRCTSSSRTIAAQVLSVRGGLRSELLFDLGGATQFLEAVAREDHHDHHHHDQPPSDTHTFERDEQPPVQRLHTVLSQLPNAILRAKGVLDLVEKPGHPVVLQSTGRRAPLTVGQPWGNRTLRTQIVFSVSRGEVDGTWIETELAAYSLVRHERPCPRVHDYLSGTRRRCRIPAIASGTEPTFARRHRFVRRMNAFAIETCPPRADTRDLLQLEGISAPVRDVQRF